MRDRTIPSYAATHEAFIPGTGRSAMIFPTLHLWRCPWCRKKKDVSHLELYSLSGDYDRKRKGWPIEYPHELRGKTGLLIGVVSHDDCGPNCGYAIEFRRLAEDPHGWVRHLKEKVWAARGEAEGMMWDVIAIHRLSSERWWHDPEFTDPEPKP
jgi:hypothetical protein